MSRIFTLWIDGLATALVWAGMRWRRPRRFRLSAHAQPLSLYAANQSKPMFSVDPKQLDKLPSKVLAQTRGSIFEIIVSPAAILERRLDPLPAASLPYVENVVLHQIDTLFPWRAADILHATTIKKRADGELDVSVRATARSAIASALALAEACGAADVAILSDREGAGEYATGIFASIAPEKESRLGRARPVARYAVFAALLLAAGVVGWTSFAGWSLASDIAALDDAIANRRAILQRSSKANDAAQNQGLEGKKQQAPVVVVVLDKLSSILPDNTYLTDLALEAGHLRISGLSANVAELVPLLEGSGYFKNASFYAPTTRMNDSATDRFSIEATVVWRKPVTP